MFVLVSAIVDRLSPVLGSGWKVADGTQHVDRTALPRADVRMQGVTLERVSGPSVLLQARFVVTLAISSASTAFSSLDSVVSGVIANLHNWRPQGYSARLQMQGIAEVDYMDQGLFGYEVAFTIALTRQGVND